MKTAISIPDNVYESAEKLASRLGQSRSQFYTKAIASYVEKHQDTNVTGKLNEIYSIVESKVSPEVQKLQSQSIVKNSEW